MTALTLQLEDSLVQRLTKRARGLKLQTYVERLIQMGLAMEPVNQTEEAQGARSLSSLYGICSLPAGETIESLRCEAMSDKFSI